MEMAKKQSSDLGEWVLPASPVPSFDRELQPSKGHITIVGLGHGSSLGDCSPMQETLAFPVPPPQPHPALQGSLLLPCNAHTH